ncbi:MAG: hypothetical protein WAL98_19340 [Desulfatiglandaceae bacterium]
MSNERNGGIGPNLTLFFRQVLLRVSYKKQVNGMFLKRCHFGPGTGQWKGKNP